MSYLQTRVITHREKVCSLYKRALRVLASFIHDKHNYRYQAVLLRQRFEENRDIKDARRAQMLLAEGEEECWQKTHYQPIFFPRSPGGVAYQRYFPPHDWMLDVWHPLEKAQYPHYFARREKRKDEFVKLWEKQYGKPDKMPH